MALGAGFPECLTIIRPPYLLGKPKRIHLRPILSLAAVNPWKGNSPTAALFISEVQ